MNTVDLAFLREHVATIDGSRPERLDEVLGRIRKARRRRATGRAVVASVVLVLAVAGGVLVNQSHRSSPEPTGPSIRGGQVVAHHPYLWWMAPGWHLARQEGAVPIVLTPCTQEPGSWGPVRAQVAVFNDPNTEGRWVNEFVLQYPDASSAHHAFLDAWHQMKICPRSGKAVDRGLLSGQRLQGFGTRAWARAGKDYDEGFSWVRRWPHYNLVPDETRMVARAGNVLVVLEGTVVGDERLPFLLQQAVQQALPHYVNLR